MKKATKSWIASGLIASLLFMLVRPQLAAAINSQQIEGLYMASTGVEVGTVVVNSYRQIEYTFENKKKVITEDNHSHADPDTDGEYIVWISQLGPYWQVFRYSLVTEETIQLTTSGNNVNPKVSGERVAWEKQVNGVWQVMMFDGIRVKQMTRSSRPSQDVDVEGDWLVYRQKVSQGEWRVYIIALLTGRIIDLGEGYGPEFIEDELVWWTQPGESVIRRTYQFGVEVEPIATPEATVSATLESTPEPSPGLEIVTEEDILEELEIATPSGEIEEATKAGELLETD
jgi:hypothetical protein